jgi:hypothetical protein
MENLAPEDILTSHEAKKSILNLPAKDGSTPRASYKNSKSHPEANTVSASNRKKDTKLRNGLPQLSFGVERSSTGVVSTHQVQHSLIFGHWVKISKDRKIEIGQKWRLTYPKLLRL